MGQRIGLVTYHKEPNLTDDDRPLIGELASIGATGIPVRWDDRSVDWARFDALIVRSCWDYHVRHDEFVAWLHGVERAAVPTFNPVPLVRWNMDKRYLRDLKDKGIAVPDTLWLERGDPRSLAELLRDAGWNEAIVKPAISASATDTWKTSARDAAGHEPQFRALAARAPVLVQRYIAEIETSGEWSVVFIGGRFSHSAIKRPRSGDFRVQKEHGGSAEPADAPRVVVEASQAVVDALPLQPLFARIDGVGTGAGYVLMEAECIEPDLFLRFRPESRRELVTALSRRV